MSEPIVRIAAWSGPRNISTALLRSFENRPDAVVCDEPLYAHYLETARAPHPVAEEIVAAEESDWRTVVAWLTEGPLRPGPFRRGAGPGAPVPGARVFYQKHMAHHLLPSVGRAWLAGLTHVFLIREPREMLLSLAKILEEPVLADTGLPQQVELFDELRARDGVPPRVLDAQDVLLDPPRALRLLCERVGIAFDARMLSWPAGRRPSDGTWAPHWYASVEASTGFERWRERPGELSGELAELHRRCLPLYEHLRAHRLGA